MANNKNHEVVFELLFRYEVFGGTGQPEEVAERVLCTNTKFDIMITNFERAKKVLKYNPDGYSNKGKPLPDDIAALTVMKPGVVWGKNTPVLHIKLFNDNNEEILEEVSVYMSYGYAPLSLEVRVPQPDLIYEF